MSHRSGDLSVDHSPTDLSIRIPPIERSDIPPIGRSITKEVLKESFKKPAQESSLCEQKPK